ncbi:unnamed protein product [Urochloa humidicola]
MERLVSPLPSPPPGAVTPTSPTPAPIPGPAATHPAAQAKPSTQAPVTTFPSSTHPNARSPLPAGRSKEERWSDNSPTSASSSESADAETGRRSYRDVAAASVDSVATSKLPLPVIAKSPPRIVLRSPVRISPPTRYAQDEDGWEYVESRSERRKRAASSRWPRRPVPVDLRGRCFNCFSDGHRAAQCKSQTRCFRCRALGHRSSTCPRRVSTTPVGNKGSAELSRRALVWRRVTPAMEQVPMGAPQAVVSSIEQAARGVASDVPRVDESSALPPPDSERSGRRRRRPRHRRRRASQANVETGPNTAAGNGREASPAPPARNDGAPPARGPPCVIDWSTQLARAEADLRQSVFVTVVGDISGLAIEDLKAVVTNAFVLNPDSLEFRRSGHDHTYIMFVEDEATITRITNAGPTPGPGDLQLHCRRWSRQAFAEGVPLPVLANVEFRGIPAHAWEMSTAESLLSPYGWPHLLKPDTRNREDYSVFRVSAWCFNLNEIPRLRDLHIVEPPVGEIIVPPGKLSLRYPVTIKVSEIQEPGAVSTDRESSDSGEENMGNRRHQRRRGNSLCVHGGASAAAATDGPAVGDRLGPDASGVRHVVCPVEADGSSSQAACLEPPSIDGAAGAVTAPGTKEAVEVNGCGAEELASGFDEIKEASGLPDLNPTGSVDLVDGILGHPMGWAVCQHAPTNSREQEIQENDSDTLPSVQSPTLVCFAVTNHEQHTNLPCDSTIQQQEQIPGDYNIKENSEASRQFQCNLGSPPGRVQVDAEDLSLASPAIPASPPITWRPAEDVLPTELSIGPVSVLADREITKVYARRQKMSVQQEIQQLPEDAACDTATIQILPSTPPPPAASASFIKNVTKPLDTTLPIPSVKQQRRRHDYVGTEPPRRSRRIANLPPENHNPAATSVCRELGFTDEKSKVSAAMVEKYQEFFNTPLKRNDVKVMAAMLRKELPDELPARTNGVLVVA